MGITGLSGAGTTGPFTPAGRIVMAKVIKFDSQSPSANKVTSETKQLRGTVIEFPRQKLNVENEEIEETSGTNPPTVFFGCF